MARMKKNEIEKLLNEINTKLDRLLSLIETTPNGLEQALTFTSDRLFDEYVNGEKGNG